MTPLSELDEYDSLFLWDNYCKRKLRNDIDTFIENANTSIEEESYDIESLTLLYNTLVSRNNQLNLSTSQLVTLDEIHDIISGEKIDNTVHSFVVEKNDFIELYNRLNDEQKESIVNTMKKYLDNNYK